MTWVESPVPLMQSERSSRLYEATFSPDLKGDAMSGQDLERSQQRPGKREHSTQPIIHFNSESLSFVG